MKLQKVVFVAVIQLLSSLAGAGSSPSDALPGDPMQAEVETMTEQVLMDWRRRRVMPEAIANLLPRALVVGEIADVPEGAPVAGFVRLQSLATLKVRGYVQRYLSIHSPDVWVVRPDVGSPSLLLAGQLENSGEAGAPRYLRLLLLDAQTGMVLSRAQWPIHVAAADAAPTTFEAASPVRISYVAAKSRDAWRAFGHPIGTLSGGEALLGVSARLAQAENAYLNGDYRSAIALYERAVALPGVNRMRLYSGEYLSYLKLDRREESRDALRRVIAEGLSAGSFGIKFEFRSGGTDFRTDASARSAYEQWLKLIAEQASATSACLQIVDHTVATDDPTLSLARSERIRDLLQIAAPSLAPRLSAKRGDPSEKVELSDADKAQDAADRRVEFHVVRCKDWR